MDNSTIRHRIRLADTPDLKEAVESLLSCEGVLQVSLRGPVLNIRYDCKTLLWQDIEDYLLKNQAEPAKGLLNRLKRSWFRFCDQNTRDNANYQASCCNKPPRQR